MPKRWNVSAKPKSKEGKIAEPPPKLQRPKSKRRNLLKALDILASMPQEVFDAVGEMKRADRLGTRYAARIPRARQSK
jgi:hypothetical protein